MVQKSGKTDPKNITEKERLKLQLQKKSSQKRRQSIFLGMDRATECAPTETKASALKSIYEQTDATISLDSSSESEGESQTKLIKPNLKRFNSEKKKIQDQLLSDQTKLLDFSKPI